MIRNTLTLLTTAFALAAARCPLAAAEGTAVVRHFVEDHCVSCHGARRPKGNIDLESALAEDIAKHPQVWERVVRKLSVRQMPPLGRSRPEDSDYEAVTAALEEALDDAAARSPRPGRTDTFRRLTRTEYRNAIRDLLRLDIDPAALLPADPSSHGFDNVTVGELSPTLLERYVRAAEMISRLAVGAPPSVPRGETFRVPPDRTQERHVAGLPLGTRGGVLLRHTFPLTGEYAIRVRLARDRDELVEGLRKPNELEVLLDRRRVASFVVERPGDGDHSKVDRHLEARVPVRAGPHELGVTFAKTSSSLVEARRQPYQARFNRHRHPRLHPAVYQVTVTGPFAAEGPGDTPSRRQLFISTPAPGGDTALAERSAEEILCRLIRRAYRRPVTDDDLARPMAFYREGAAEAGFEAGIQRAVSAVLVSPRFLFRIETQPAGVTPGTAYPVPDLDLASRLSFFIWSSIPDDELIDLAARGTLREPEVLRGQVARMLADERARSLVENFAAQWLHLPNLRSVRPDQRLFPDFDDNLRESLRRETELFVASVFREDRSVLELLRADYTFLDERLARHYEIPHVHGSRFRRVALEPEDGRGGLLRHGSILTVTSYATRTSPVIRGHWVLDNLLGAPPPPPPPDVPALEDNRVDASLPVRARLEEHRENRACSSCHAMMDPVGLALEGYDAVGRTRTLEAGRPVDASGALPGFAEFEGAGGLEDALLAHPDIFLRTLAEKLLTFALGRGVEYHDAPAIRAIVRTTRAGGCRFSTLVEEIVKSPPFQMRTAR